MGDFSDFEEVRDFIADRLLDGHKVISVGIAGSGDERFVGITATSTVPLPALPIHLAHVPVRVQITDGVARSQSANLVSRWLRKFTCAHEWEIVDEVEAGDPATWESWVEVYRHCPKCDRSKMTRSSLV